MNFDHTCITAATSSSSASSIASASASSSAAAKPQQQQQRPPNSPGLKEVAKRWRDAKNKLVLKNKLSNVILGSDTFEFKDEPFRNRRRELLEKAKELEELAKKAKQKEKEARLKTSDISDTKNENNDD